MRQRQLLAGHDPDGVTSGDGSLLPLEEAPSPETAFARAKALQKRELERGAQVRRN